MSKKQKAVFLDRDGVINRGKSFVTTPAELQVYSFAGKAIKQLNDASFLVFVITNQSGVARGLYTEAQLQEIHNKMCDTLAKDNAIINHIFYCPHHPGGNNFPEHTKAYQGPCNCRKPNTGMIQQALKLHDIDLKKSYLMGDHKTDIMCGKTMGLTTIGVRTGHGVEGEVVPDVMVGDLRAGVAFILSDLE